MLEMEEETSHFSLSHHYSQSEAVTVFLNLTTPHQC